MEFKDAVSSVFKKYATFSGRASRSEYWYFVLFNMIASFAVTILFSIIGAILAGVAGAVAGYYISMLYGLVVLIPTLAVSVRRLHDIGKSGWFFLIVLIPLIGGLVLLYFFVQPSNINDNQYGAKPE